MIWFVPLIAAILLFSGLALAYVIGGSTVLAFIATDNARYLAILPQKIFSQINVFSLLSMPLFILAGELMNRGGITKSLIELSMLLVGRMKGGLGHVNVMTSVFFAGISGSAVADAAALSNTLVPAMEAKGYPRKFAAAITAASSIIGPIFPPSIILIFYGAVMQTSVAALFAAGIVPALLMAAALFALNTFYAWKDNHPREVVVSGKNAVLKTIVSALPAALLPVIILVGIVLGWMTPTEAAAVAVFAAIVIGYFYDGFTLQSLRESLQRTAILSGSIFMILCAISALGYLVALERIPTAILSGVAALGLSATGYLLLINLTFIVAGMFLDVAVALALLVPLLAPVALVSGVDPVHLGIVICLNLAIGMITPPLGGCLLIVSSVTGFNYWQLARAILPFVLVELIVLLIIMFVPDLSLYLPRLFGLWS